jgi:hypothetical protein
VPNSIIISKSNITSSNESTDYTTDSNHMHVKCQRKHKSSRHFTPKQHTIMQQPGRWTLWRWLQLDEDISENEQQGTEKKAINARE